MDNRDDDHSKFFAWVDSADRDSLLTQYSDLYTAAHYTNPYVNHRAMSDDEIREMIKQFVSGKLKKEAALNNLRAVIREELKRLI